MVLGRNWRTVRIRPVLECRYGQPNYSLRKHLFKPQKRKVVNIANKKYPDILILHPMEIFAAKINALLSRAATRDIYDTHNLLNSPVLQDFGNDLFRKAIVFYSAVSQKKCL